jgi:hypothetical protein
MPFLINGSRRGGRFAALAGVIAICGLAAPAAQAAGVSNPYDCKPQPQLSQAFSQFGDLAQYTPVDNAGLENGTGGWTLSGGASVVSDQEPWKVAGDNGTHSLDLPHGSSAVSAPMCIDPTYPYFRFFLKKLNTNGDALKIDVIYYDSKGNVTHTAPLDYATKTTGWQASSQIKIGVFSSSTTVAAAPVAFRFTPNASQGHYQIDDVLVDPMCRR